MTKTQHIPRKEMQINQIIALWYEYHETYSSLYFEYLELSQQNVGYKNAKMRPSRLSVREYGPSWANFLLKDSEDEVRSFLSEKHRNTISEIYRDGHADSIEFLIRNLRSILPDWHWWVNAGSKGASSYGASPSSCGGGRHYSSYSRVTWVTD